MLDLAKRKGSDQVVGLLEDTVTFAPELNVLAGRPIIGTQYKTTHRTLPTVSFRKANDGSDTVKGAYSQKLHECMIVDGQMQADKAVVDAEGTGSGPEGSIGNILVDEAQGVIMAAYITVGAQMYYGTGQDANGFIGFNSLMPTLNAAKNSNPVVVGAGGTTASVQTSAYLVWESIKGVHFIFGGNNSLTMLPEWRIQQVNGANSKAMTAYVNNLQGWIGLAVNHPLSVARIANINLATDTKPLTDALVAKALSYMPLQMRGEVIANVNNGGPNKWGGGLKLFMNPQAAYSLQQSRSPVSSGTGTAITSDRPLSFADLPTSSNGVPIVLTDSIVNTEAVLV